MSTQLTKLFGKKKESPQDIDFVSISLASPEKIRSWSYGEVKKPETINYRTFKPERDGLFCARIFGPVKDYECLCGKYKRIKYKGVICEKCGVEVTRAKVRRDRMGHIDLATPIAHIWFTKTLPSRVANVLDMSLRDLEKILYFESHVVLEPGLTPLKKYQLLTEDEFVDAQDNYGEDAFEASIGAEALREMLKSINLSEEAAKLRAELEEIKSELQRNKVVKRLKIIEGMIEANVRPEWMVMDVIPVLPPDLRPLVPLDGGRFATSDLNDLYRRVINRNNRLKRLISLNAPDIILRNEKRMLQEAVDALFDNGRRGKVITGTNKRPLKSLSDMLKGKQGRFRQNLLGKRVDYSGRSVIVVGPDLMLHQCGLPKKMALELFKPFVFSRLERYGIATTLKAAKKMVENERPEVWDILEEVIREHPVLLNRAPTLHRLGIQAFEPKLIEGKAIQLHPLVCTAFNADFDGDQMAVHVPLSIEAQLEARVLMMSTNNILAPSSGRPIIIPTKDMVLGLYYLTLMREGLPGEGMYFAHMGEIEHALSEKIIHLHTKIKAKYRTVNEKGETIYQTVDTTPGRMLLSEIFPRHHNVDFSLINKTMTSKDISSVIDVVYRHCGQKETVIFADKLMNYGFKYATESGISFGKDYLIVPEEKEQIVQETRQKVNEYERQYLDGLITQKEKYNKVVDAWAQCTDKIAEVMMEKMSKVEPGKQLNSIYMMAHSGARGSATQMKQLAGMRGLMAKPTGEIIETPIVSNFKEGLTVLEYFTSTHGARKGLSDTALKTANSGYLTRRLVDVAQDMTVVKEDCGTDQGLTIRAVVDGGDVVASLSERILGRTLLEDVVDHSSGKVVAKAGEIVNEDIAEAVEKAGVDEVKVRSVLTCSLKTGTCAMCYGRDLARGEKVNVGEAVGVIAAQSIGEPGTQLTMRTFHIGGAAQRGTEKSSAESAIDGTVHIRETNIVKDSEGFDIVMSRYGELVIRDENGREKARYRIPYGSKLLVKDEAKVKKDQKLAEWDPYTVPIITEKDGVADFVDLISSVTVKDSVDEATGMVSRVVIDAKSGANLKPRITIKDEKGKPVLLSNGMEARYFMPVGAVLVVESGAKVKAGDVLARIPREAAKTRDITGGLPRVAELFEGRRPKNSAIIAEIDGRIEFGKDNRSKRSIIINPLDDNLEPVEYLIPSGRHITVFEGDMVKKGDVIVDGSMDPHDILRILGVKALAEYLVAEVQEVYRLQGVKINDKHIEVIVSQMLSKVEIIDAGDSTYLVGEEFDKLEIEEENEKLAKAGKRQIQYAPVLQGITKASLHTKSFLSAASFQETTRVLTDAALTKRVDKLEGLKENIIVGRLIPAGTGFVRNEFRDEAIEQDKKALAKLNSDDSSDDSSNTAVASSSV